MVVALLDQWPVPALPRRVAADLLRGGGTFGGMRRKTSLTLDDAVIALARAGAQREGRALSHWVERAIINEASRNEVDLIEQWERQLSPDDRAVLAAFAEADRLAEWDE